ncbi:MAG: RimK/LysX family protein [Methanobacteriaceae archaeon]|nr:RimK/LysX family protein [Methanobacteriaceae archaeon]MDP2835567.1 RimK/LysX family protein [Methanobacteriaceae archaeon]MDP3484237.1 RimK/LysX family protein [Methanobacteriaceae archaeon]MDP3623020.1 RimK/LysX family protein [Methanobacteriaceae archaeon]
MESSELKKLLKFSLQEKKIIKELELPENAFLPLIFSIRFGGDWSLNKNSKKVMSIKEKLTQYDEEKKIGYTLERVYLFLNPVILAQEGIVYRLEKCSNKQEREMVKRPYKVSVNADYILEATLDPIESEIRLKKINNPLNFTGPSAYGVSHEMEHLEEKETKGKPFWEFEYKIEDS